MSRISALDLNTRLPTKLFVLEMQSEGAMSEMAAAIAAQIANGQETAWNRGDGVAYASQYWPDAELVNMFGSVVEGQKEMERRFVEILSGAFKGSRVKVTIRKVRRYAPNLIVLDCDQDNTTIFPTAGDPESQKKGLRTRFKRIIEQRDGKWRIVASQNTRVITPSF